MGATIRTLLDENDDFIYPKTKTVAVYDENDNTLDEVLTPFIRGKNEQGITPIVDPILHASDIEQTPSTSTTKLVSSNAIKDISDDVAELETNLGNPSSASSVTGADAFSKISTLNSDLAKLNGIEIYNNQSQSGQAAGDIALSGSWQGYNFLTIEFSYSNTDNNYASVTVPAATGMIAHLFCAYPTSDMLYAAARMVTLKNYNTLTVGQGYLYIGNMTSNADNNAAKVRRVYAHN